MGRISRVGRLSTVAPQGEFLMWSLFLFFEFYWRINFLAKNCRSNLNVSDHENGSTMMIESYINFLKNAWVL